MMMFFIFAGKAGMEFFYDLLSGFLRSLNSESALISRQGKQERGRKFPRAPKITYSILETDLLN